MQSALLKSHQHRQMGPLELPAPVVGSISALTVATSAVVDMGVHQPSGVTFNRNDSASLFPLAAIPAVQSLGVAGFVKQLADVITRSR